MYTHSYPFTTLLSRLKAHLPRSGPLYRRIQYQVSHPSSTGHVLASFPESKPKSGLGPGAGAGDEQGEETETEPWLAAYADIHRGPDTQIWLFSSIESSSVDSGLVPHSPLGEGATPPASGSSNGNSNPQGIISRPLEITKTQLLSLFTYIQNNLVPPYISSLPTECKLLATAPVTVDEGVPKIPAHTPTSYLLGTVHTVLESLIVELRDEGKLTIHRGAGVHYVKYCFSSEAFADDSLDAVKAHSGGQEKESGYRFHDSSGTRGIQGHHIDLVKSRTNIPRSREALLAMGGVALYHDRSSQCGSPPPPEKEGGEMPIAWAFLGFDGSLCSLHVESEHRGQGLAGVVGKEVMKRGVEVFEPANGPARSSDTQEKSEWYFADVAVENTASRRVMEKMGGVVGWRVVWMVVEVAKN
ncbi:hypothetical protein BJX63DRAFT_230484 [Aspergillus granulosus]|uniref:FR47-like domain-containing protein n=1 Tax=Aspergillus granulosus TaxID=176169 RepID=A0ABR4HDC5_9EURO